MCRAFSVSSSNISGISGISLKDLQVVLGKVKGSKSCTLPKMAPLTTKLRPLKPSYLFRTNFLQFSQQMFLKLYFLARVCLHFTQENLYINGNSGYPVCILIISPFYTVLVRSIINLTGHFILLARVHLHKVRLEVDEVQKNNKQNI